MTTPKFRANVLWHHIQRGAYRLADFQARLILSLLYVLFIVPVGFFVRINEDPLQLYEQPQRTSYWQPRSPADSDMPAAHRQF